jgi:hypothetical protein
MLSSAAQAASPTKGRTVGQQAAHDAIRGKCAVMVQDVLGKKRNNARIECVRKLEGKK